MLLQAKPTDLPLLKKLIRAWGERGQAQICTGMHTGGFTQRSDGELCRVGFLSGSAEFVAVVQSPNLGYGYHWSQLRPLDGPSLRRVLLQGKMRARWVIVGEV